MTRQRTVELSPMVQARHPMLHAAMLHIAHPQNRNQGTVGGSLAHADPAAELPALALALDAEVRPSGRSGARTIAAADFFVTYLTTALEPCGDPDGRALSDCCRRARGWSIHGGGPPPRRLRARRRDRASSTLDDAGRCAAARLVLFGVGATPVRAADGRADAGRRAARARALRAGGAAARRGRSTSRSPTCTRPPTIGATSPRVLAGRALAEAAARAARVGRAWRLRDASR